MESENDEPESNCACVSDVNFSSCKVTILRELLQGCRKDIGSLKERYISLCGEQQEVHQLLEEHKEQQNKLKNANEELKLELENSSKSSEEEQEQMREKLEHLNVKLDNVTKANANLMSHVQTWDEQIDSFKLFYQDVKALVSSDIGHDENQNLIVTNYRIKQLEQELGIYKDKFVKSDDSHKQLLKAFKELRDEYAAISQRHSKMMKYTVQFMVPVLALLFASIILQFSKWNALR